ncbi:MAG TPA: hypothetical protein VMR21_05965 [Vicinamibacteria bacterium]|nr:hypothetical protein [Vicinamibacteria bacterium]
MWRHVSDAALMDVVDGAASDRVLSHVAACRQCRVQVDEAREGLALTSRATPPEPAPMYWEVMRRQVARGVTAERRPHVRPRWAVAALAGAAMAAVVAVRPGPAPEPSSLPSPVAVLPAWSPLPSGGAALPELEDLAPGALAGAPSLACTGVTECIASLDDEEVRALAEVLREEMGDGRPV